MATATKPPQEQDWRKEVRRARERRQLTQAELAILCGCSRQTILNIESGRTNASPRLIRALLQTLGPYKLPSPFG